MEITEATTTTLIEDYVESAIDGLFEGDFSVMMTLADYYSEKFDVEPEEAPEWTNGIVMYVYGECYVISRQTWEEPGEWGVRFTVEIEVNGKSVGKEYGEWEDWGDIPDLIEKVKVA